MLSLPKNINKETLSSCQISNRNFGGVDDYIKRDKKKKCHSKKDDLITRYLFDNTGEKDVLCSHNTCENIALGKLSMKY